MGKPWKFDLFIAAINTIAIVMNVVTGSITWFLLLNALTVGWFLGRLMERFHGTGEAQ